jgi:thiol-disulfide isomerase/thioredoxin
MEVEYIGAVWCATCKTIKPAITELCKKFNVPLKIRDLDKDLDGEEKDAIRKVPTLRIYKEGALAETYVQNQVASVEAYLVAHAAINTHDSADF